MAASNQLNQKQLAQAELSNLEALLGSLADLGMLKQEDVPDILRKRTRRNQLKTHKFKPEIR